MDEEKERRVKEKETRKGWKEGRRKDEIRKE